MRKLSLFWLAITLMACTTVQPTSKLATPPVENGVRNVQTALKSSVSLWGEVKSEDGKMRGYMAGSGVVVATGSKGTVVLTAGHCYVPNTTYEVENSYGKKFRATFFHVSSVEDLGLLWVKEIVGAPAILAEVMPPWGTSVYAIGNKLGGGLFPTEGIYGGQVSGKFARCSAPTHPGNSGGGIWANEMLLGIVSRIPAALHQTTDPKIKSKQLYPSVCMFVPITNVRSYLLRSGAMMQVSHPKALKGIRKIILPPSPKDWKTEIS